MRATMARLVLVALTCCLVGCAKPSGEAEHGKAEQAAPELSGLEAASKAAHANPTSGTVSDMAESEKLAEPPEQEHAKPIPEPGTCPSFDDCSLDCPEGAAIEKNEFMTLAMACYKDGVPEGTMIVWYSKSQKASQGKFSQGKMHGHFRMWYQSGAKKAEGDYKDDKREGVHSEWYPNGQLRSRKQFEDGRPVGSYQLWYDDGKKAMRTDLDRFGGMTQLCWDRAGAETDCDKVFDQTRVPNK